MPALFEIENQRTELQQKLRDKIESYPKKKGADGKDRPDIPANDLTEIKAMSDELNQVGETYDAQRKAEDLIEQKWETPVNRVPIGGSKRTDSKNLVESLLESKQYQERDSGNGRFRDAQFNVDIKSLLDLEVKTTMTTDAGFAPFISRDGKVVPAISRPPQLIDLLRVEPTDKDQVKFMKQTTRTNAAAAKGEGVALDEAAIAYTEATVDIRKIGVYIPVTEEQLEDELEIRNIIDNDLRLMVRQKFDELVTVGDGISPNILGVYNAAGVLTQAKGSDPVFDAIMKARTKVKVSGRANPNLVLLHANDYQELALTRTADGMYIYGNPTDAPLQRVWGVQIATSEALTEGNGLVMDTDYIRLKMRKDVTIAATDSHGTLFINNVTVLRAHMRAGLQILRDEAICRVTGI